jgi:cell wall-associated NlpC family hydrolase
MKNIKKYIVSGVLSISLLVGTVNPVPASSGRVFNDTYKAQWAEPSIVGLYNKNIMRGITSTQFAPKAPITRAEFATILSRAVNRPAAITSIPFQDVPKSKWYYSSVKKAYSMGIVKGVSYNRFQPDRPITREEAAAILSHTFNYPHTSSALPYRDAGNIGRWAVSSVQAVTQKKIFVGTDGYFHPRKALTRAEAAAVIYKALYGKAPAAPAPSRTVASRSGDRLGELLYRAVNPLLGVPYRWGGTTTSGFDCSGFTSYVYRSVGMELPRTAASQFAKGSAVSTNAMEPGDLVFFDTGSGSISHVGIFMGNGKMAHAASGQGKVVINDIDWYLSHYRVVGIKRYL